jgi:hypothetical protein
VSGVQPFAYAARMSDSDWPAPERSEPRGPERQPASLPRIEDLPVAEQGYDREHVREAFDAFYRHAAQLDATLRTLEAVEVFQRTAAELRAELRTVRGSGWTVQSWQGGGYGGRGVHEWTFPPAFPRLVGEFAFLIAVGVVVGVAGWSSLTIVLVMAAALAIVLLIEAVAARERAVPTATAPAAVPELDEEPEPEASRPEWVAEHEGPEAMTMLDAAAVREAEEPAPAEPEPVRTGDSPGTVPAEAEPAILGTVPGTVPDEVDELEEPEPEAAFEADRVVELEPEQPATVADLESAGDSPGTVPSKEPSEAETPVVQEASSAAPALEEEAPAEEAPAEPVTPAPARGRRRLWLFGRRSDAPVAEVVAAEAVIAAAPPAEPEEPMAAGDDDAASGATVDPWEQDAQLPDLPGVPETDAPDEEDVAPEGEAEPPAEVIAESQPTPTPVVGGTSVQRRAPRRARRR